MADIPPGKSDSLPKRRPGSPPGRRFLGLAPGKNPAAPAGPRGAARIFSLFHRDQKHSALFRRSLQLVGRPDGLYRGAVGFRQRPQVLLPCSAQDKRRGVRLLRLELPQLQRAHLRNSAAGKGRQQERAAACQLPGGRVWLGLEALEGRNGEFRILPGRNFPVPFQCSSALFRPSPCR